MARYKVILTYDGTAYYGFQRQLELNGMQTIQGELEKALRKIGWQGKAILGAGRTDTGVHAFGQVIAFNLEWNHSDDKLRSALNANLPIDIAALSVSAVHESFHPRYDAKSRCYRYHLYHEDVRDPMKERYAWRVLPKLDEKIVSKISQQLLGKHDFGAFGTPPLEGGSTHRNVFSVKWMFKLEDSYFEIVANAFLYHMVRRIVQLLVQIGQNRVEADILINALRNPEDGKIQGLAPAKGLSLVEITY
jgi:tRNA pseudouridine38-40 synthase